MKLSDVMSAADLAVYAEVGLVLFLGAFLAVAVRVVFFSCAQEYNEVLMIPLADDSGGSSAAAPVANQTQGESS